jgi:hypothetical protein
MIDRNILFIQELLRVIPSLVAIYREHVTDNGELLPHLFFGDVARYVIDETRDPDAIGPLRQLLGQIEIELERHNLETEELIGVSFVENLCGEVAALNVLIPMMGPELRRETSTICGI